MAQLKAQAVDSPTVVTSTPRAGAIPATPGMDRSTSKKNVTIVLDNTQVSLPSSPKEPVLSFGFSRSNSAPASNSNVDTPAASYQHQPDVKDLIGVASIIKVVDLDEQSRKNSKTLKLFSFRRSSGTNTVASDGSSRSATATREVEQEFPPFDMNILERVSSRDDSGSSSRRLSGFGASSSSTNMALRVDGASASESTSSAGPTEVLEAIREEADARSRSMKRSHSLDVKKSSSLFSNNNKTGTPKKSTKAIKLLTSMWKPVPTVPKLLTKPDDGGSFEFRDALAYIYYQQKDFFKGNTSKFRISVTDVIDRKFYFYPIDPDGSCGFTAIARGLKANGRFVTPQEIRFALRTEVLSNGGFYNQQAKENEAFGYCKKNHSAKSLAEAAIHSGHTGHWLGEKWGSMEVLAIAKNMGITIELFCFDKAMNRLRSYDLFNYGEVYVGLLFSGYCLGGHFDLLTDCKAL